MSYGVVMCSNCKHEVHQSGPRDPLTNRYGWEHCDLKTAMCAGADAVYPPNRAAIAGKFCLADEGGINGNF